MPNSLDATRETRRVWFLRGWYRVEFIENPRVARTPDNQKSVPMPPLGTGDSHRLRATATSDVDASSDLHSIFLNSLLAYALVRVLLRAGAATGFLASGILPQSGSDEAHNRRYMPGPHFAGLDSTSIFEVSIPVAIPGLLPSDQIQRRPSVCLWCSTDF